MAHAATDAANLTVTVSLSTNHGGFSMRCHSLISLTVVAVSLFAARLDAQQFQYISAHAGGGCACDACSGNASDAAPSTGGGCDAAGGGCCDTGYGGCDACGGSLCCCDQSAMYFQYENTFFRYHRADGVRVGVAEPDEQVEFDFEYAPRITLGFVGPRGLGLRFRYWDYDHLQWAREGVSNTFLDVNTYNFDTEFFEEIELNCCTSLELSAGIRYNDFDEHLVDGGVVNMNTSFSGWGGMLGAQVNRSLGRGALFARGRTAILMSDARVLDGVGDLVHLLDSTQGMTEIALGYEVSACLGRATVTTSIAGEWQNWNNFSSNFSAGINETNAAGRSDVGFGGIVISTAVEF